MPWWAWIGVALLWLHGIGGTVLLVLILYAAAIADEDEEGW